MTSAVEETEPGGARLSHERFLDFERGVLQDNITLCDAKSGVLLAFSGGMVIFCIETLVAAHQAAGRSISLTEVLAALAGLAFLVSCHFSLSTVVPRLLRRRDDHIFWESSVFKLSSEAYLAAMEGLDREAERRDMLLHLHMLAGICRSKFWHFNWAIRIAQLAFALLVVAELCRLLA
ncbi:MAG TPA: Pycsar system effector family protein [Caulobacteraceae bacterium]|nr:Pycsar system effector family protein [Caulobacteraceae bacterium]